MKIREGFGLFYKKCLHVYYFNKNLNDKKIGHFHRILKFNLMDCNGFVHQCQSFLIHGLLLAGAGKKSIEYWDCFRRAFSTSQISPSHWLRVLGGGLQSAKWV